MFRTNKVKLQVDAVKLYERYNIFKININGCKFINRKHLDDPILKENVCSVFSNKPTELYVLMNKNELNKQLLMHVLNETDVKDRFSISNATDEANEVIIINLLLNALGAFSDERFRVNNLTGHLYYFFSDLFIKGTYNGEKIIKQIPCLEFRITDDLYLSINVRTFTNIKLKKYLENKKKPLSMYPKYVLSLGNSLRRAKTTDKEEQFVLKQIGNNKSALSFLDISKLSAFECSKCGAINSVLQRFDNKYSSIAKIELSTFKESSAVSTKYSSTVKHKNNVLNLLKNKGIVLVDKVNNDVSTYAIQQLASIIDSDYDIKSCIKNEPIKGCLNISIINDKSFYTENELQDAHIESTDLAVQHVTLENCLNISRTLVRTLINELLIKDDIISHHISLFDWGKLGFNGCTTFGIKLDGEDVTKFAFMDIDPSGKFNLSIAELDLFSNNKYSKLIDVLMADKDSEGIICFDDGSINIIKSTEWMTLPDVSGLNTELKTGNNKLKNKEARDAYLQSNVDIRMFTDNDKTYYFVGDFGSGMTSKQNTASRIREIATADNSDMRFNELLSTMDVVFVRNNQLTVLPFPFKYLREYANISITEN